MTAVIYARYSSDNQREESIEGQIRECTAYAEKNGITVIKHYIDRAFSAKTDNRPEFQQMIKDSGKKLFDVVLVWKFDRFVRNRFDSANYKMILKKNGVHLISVMEPIAEGSQGILVETLLEGMAEYYSAELSEKVIRGQTENALKGKCTGGTGTIGYKIDEDKFYHLDPLTSPLVLEAFQRYDNGDKMVEIVNFLNDKGVRNMLGGKMTHSSVNTMLKNRRYIGELSFRDIVVPDAIPVIVPKDLFDRVQKRLDKNKRAPACGKADEEYLLTTKLLCGKCGALMFGESGTSATGRTYYYYKCANVKRRKGCNKKTVQKDWLEDLVVRETMKLIQDDAVIDKIVQLVMDVQNQENTTIPLLEKQLREVNKKLDNLMKAIEDGLYTRTTKERLEALEIQKDELTAKIADEKLKKPSFNEDFIRFWLMKFRKFDISQKKQRKALIEIFVNAIFLYDDRMLLTFNYKDGTQTVRFEDTLTADCGEKSLRLRSNESPSGAFEQQNGLAQARWRGLAPTSSDLSSSAGPRASRFICWLFCCNKRPGQGRTLCPGLSARCGGRQPSILCSTKSPTILSSWLTACSAPLAILRAVRRIWRWLVLVAMTPAAPSAAPAAMPIRSGAVELVRSFFIGGTPFESKFLGCEDSISTKGFTIRFFCAGKCGILYDMLINWAGYGLAWFMGKGIFCEGGFFFAEDNGTEKSSLHS